MDSIISGEEYYIRGHIKYTDGVEDPTKEAYMICTDDRDILVGAQDYDPNDDAYVFTLESVSADAYTFKSKLNGQFIHKHNSNGDEIAKTESNDFTLYVKKLDGAYPGIHVISTQPDGQGDILTMPNNHLNTQIIFQASPQPDNATHRWKFKKVNKGQDLKSS